LSVIHRISGAALGTHFADQIALVSVPLVAALAFGASAQTIGLLVACQSTAHLLGSIPFGILVDQQQLRSLAISSSLISLVAFSGAALSILAGSLVWFAVAITLAGFGVVLFSLTALSILPRTARPGALVKANAAVEIPRAMCSFAVPLAIGLAIGRVPVWSVFAIACLGSLLALKLNISLPKFDVTPKPKTAVLQRICDGGRYVIGHNFLRPIALCSILWNLAFAALLVVLVPTIRELYRFAPGSFGFALSAFGLAAVCASSLSGKLTGHIAPSVILLFAPGSSVIATAGLMLIGPDTNQLWLYACFFLLGFGPSMWLIAQNSLRQLVTPPAMLGRVNAVIQTAIYGVRPLGALIGGLLAGGFGAHAGLTFVVGAYALSFLVSLFSGLRSVGSYQALYVPADL